MALTTYPELELSQIAPRVPLGTIEWALIVLGALNAVDAFCTLHWVTHGLATEANPVMDWALTLGPAWFISAKLALVTLGCVGLWRHKERRVVRVASMPLVALYAMVCAGHLAFAVGA